MSSTKEYGGAHEKHANGFDVNNISVSENNSEKTRVFCEKNSADQILSFQDHSFYHMGFAISDQRVTTVTSFILDLQKK
jgi:hypothetical protein